MKNNLKNEKNTKKRRKIKKTKKNEGSQMSLLDGVVVEGLLMDVMIG